MNEDEDGMKSARYLPHVGLVLLERLLCGETHLYLGGVTFHLLTCPFRLERDVG